MSAWTQLLLDSDGATALHPAKARALARRVDSGWHRQAACAGQDPERWFPVSRKPTADTRRAVRICAGCGVRRSCLALALLGDGTDCRRPPGRDAS